MALINRDVLEELFNATVNALSEKLKSGDATAADISAAIKLLQNNGVELPPIDGNTTHNIVHDLPFGDRVDTKSFN